MDENGQVLGIPGIALNPDQERKRKLEQDILTIEGLFFSINSAQYSPKFMDALNRGLTYLGTIHVSLLAQMSPEDLKAMREKYNKPNPPINPQEVA